MDECSKFREIMEESIKKNGTQPLTNLWLLNIIKLVDKHSEHQENIHNNMIFDPNWD